MNVIAFIVLGIVEGKLQSRATQETQKIRGVYVVLSVQPVQQKSLNTWNRGNLMQIIGFAGFGGAGMSKGGNLEMSNGRKPLLPLGRRKGGRRILKPKLCGGDLAA